jgi:3-dehydrosphinganine reductase
MPALGLVKSAFRKPVIVMSSLSHIAALHDGCFYVGAGTVLVTTLVVVWTWASSAVRLCCSRPVNYVGKHAVITGGSTGIGRAVALELASRGASVTLVARTKSKLEAAVRGIEASVLTSPAAGQTIRFECADVTDPATVRAAFKRAAAAAGDIDVLVACAGASHPGYFLDQDIEVFDRSMRLNYLGTVAAVKAAAPGMCARGEGHIVLVASAAAVISFIGYSSYAPTKFALRGLADSLRNELCGFGVRVSIAYPPDTDTPGFEKENLSKPAETRAVSPPEVWPAADVARSMVASMARGDYHLSSPDLVQNMLVSTMAGVTPRRHLLLETMLQPVLCLAERAFLWHADREAARYGARKRAEAETPSTGAARRTARGSRSRSRSRGRGGKSKRE